MFTGLIEALGTVTDVQPRPGGLRIRLETALAPDLGLGDSIAVNGVCLTVVELEPSALCADVSPETMRVTALGTWRAGTRVNLERPLSPTARLGGHFVQGHVDAVGTLAEIAPDAEFWRVAVTYPAGIAPYLVPKGSIAVDGISLTVASLAPGRFDVQIVPFTWEHTHLHARAVDDAVNLECDIIGKYVVRAVSAYADAAAPLREEP